MSRSGSQIPPPNCWRRAAQAELLFRRIGITFAVYGDKEAAERLIPFDIIPRMISRPNGRGSRPADAARQGAQHVPRRIYGEREILKAGSFPPN